MTAPQQHIEITKACGCCTKFKKIGYEDDPLSTLKYNGVIVKSTSYGHCSMKNAEVWSHELCERFDPVPHTTMVKVRNRKEPKVKTQKELF